MTPRQKKIIAKPEGDLRKELRQTYLLTNKIGNTIPSDTARSEKIISAILRRNKSYKPKRGK